MQDCNWLDSDQTATADLCLSKIVSLSLSLFIGCLCYSTSPIILSVCPVPLAQRSPPSNLNSRSLFTATVPSQRLFLTVCLPFCCLLFFLEPSQANRYQVTQVDGYTVLCHFLSFFFLFFLFFPPFLLICIKTCQSAMMHQLEFNECVTLIASSPPRSF